MTPSQAYEYARGCALARPTVNNAILCLRNLIEEYKLDRETAIRETMNAFPLGMIEQGDIAEEARRRYPEVRT